LKHANADVEVEDIDEIIAQQNFASVVTDEGAQTDEEGQTSARPKTEREVDRIFSKYYDLNVLSKRVKDHETIERYDMDLQD